MKQTSCTAQAREPYAAVTQVSGSVRDARSVTGVRERVEPVFLDAEVVGRWEKAGRATLSGPVLTLPARGETLLLQEAVRVLGPSSGADAYGWSGRVMTLREVLDLGGVLQRERLRVGATSYDMQLGYLAFPLQR